MHRLARLVPLWDAGTGDKKYLPFSHPPRRGDVIVFNDPTGASRDLVKRVVGLPGEVVKIMEGTVYINGTKLDEPYLEGFHYTGSIECIPKSRDCGLQEDEFFVIGDNRGNSNDSRYWGPVPLQNIVGKVWFGY